MGKRVQVITTRDLIESLEKALKEETLGFFNSANGGGQYRYPDGRRCAIGACMTDQTLEKVRSTERTENNYLSARALHEDYGLLRFENDITKSLAIGLQSLHDNTLRYRERVDTSFSRVDEKDFERTPDGFRACVAHLRRKFLGEETRLAE